MIIEYLENIGWVVLFCLVLYVFIRIIGEAWFTAKGQFMKKYFFNKGENDDTI